MAYNMHYVCAACEREVYGPPADNKVCPACIEKADSETRDTHLHELRGLPLAERLQRIEEFMYNQEADRNKTRWPGVVYK